MNSLLHGHVCAHCLIGVCPMFPYPIWVSLEWRRFTYPSMRSHVLMFIDIIIHLVVLWATCMMTCLFSFLCRVCCGPRIYSLISSDNCLSSFKSSNFSGCSSRTQCAKSSPNAQAGRAECVSGDALRSLRAWACGAVESHKMKSDVHSDNRICPDTNYRSRSKGERAFCHLRGQLANAFTYE